MSVNFFTMKKTNTQGYTHYFHNNTFYKWMQAKIRQIQKYHKTITSLVYGKIVSSFILLCMWCARAVNCFYFPQIGCKIIILIAFWKMLLWICMFIYLLWVRINNYYLYRNSIIRHKFYSKVSEYPLKPYLVTCKYNLITYNMQKKFRRKGNSIALPKSDVRLDQKQVFFI